MLRWDHVIIILAKGHFIVLVGGPPPLPPLPLTTGQIPLKLVV